MEFKEWLLNEEGNHGQEGFVGGGESDNGCAWDLIYPTEAGDYPIDVATPKYFWWMQWRWKRGEQIGRPLYNIDPDILNWKYVSPFSTTIPNDESWEHKSDSGSSIGVAKNLDLVRMGVGKSHTEPLILDGPMVNGHQMGSDPTPPPHTAANKGPTCGIRRTSKNVQSD